MLGCWWFLLIFLYFVDFVKTKVIYEWVYIQIYRHDSIQAGVRNLSLSAKTRAYRTNDMWKKHIESVDDYDTFPQRIIEKLRLFKMENMNFRVEGRV